MSPTRPVEPQDDDLPPTSGGPRDPGEPEPKRSGLFYLVGILVFAATVIGVVGIGRHRNHEAHDDAQSREADVKQGPRVRVATVKQAPGIRHLSLQGEARPFFEVTLYAKVAGFLSDLKVDKGDRVKKNQLIAKVTAPELDAQYSAAVADARNKRVNAKRLTALAPAGVLGFVQTAATELPKLAELLNAVKTVPAPTIPAA